MFFSILREHKGLSEIFVYISIGSISFLDIGIAFLAAIWLLYFLSRLRSLSKKIHYLKKQTDERCKQELTNARVDYIKSLFIAAICACEILQSWLLIMTISTELGVARFVLPDPNNSNCTWNRFFEYIQDFTAARGLFALEISSMLLYMSLVHILTSYLSNAYADKRVIKLTKRELFMFVLLLTQLVILWLSVYSWRVFIFVLTFVIISIIPIHLFFYIKYSRKLYSHIKRRALDAWFEDIHSYKNLEQMRNDYKHGTLLYTISTVLFGIVLTGFVIISLIRLLLAYPCKVKQLINTQSQWSTPFFTKHQTAIAVTSLILERFLFNSLTVFAVFFMFLLHASILYKAVRRLLQRRRAYNRHAGIHYNHMYQPLIGNK
ncbi:hypothetical protein LOD99_13899 [Oopsacas minuta]|uniref:Uncharacterized protein n=1 Tax=Oopsacas minuta TaxID=111878 RepID=A0AAV7KK20_9METZ|nr:hypothetical protein LOD99_13899 [Oopsacas minuta]